MEAILFNSTGVESGKIKLNEEIFSKEANDGLIHRLLMLQRSNSRNPIAHTKTRGERRGSTRKVYKQKGTGNARVGGARSPIRKGGGVAFGPRSNRNFTISMNRKERRLALFTLLSVKARNNQVKIIESVSMDDSKTKNMLTIANNMQIVTALFAMLPDDRNLFLATRNLKNIKPIGVNYLNPADLLKYKDLVFTKESLDFLGQIYS
ncbi:MAG: 50S ribosomal protein L4 [Candidatus Gracilibacteria bacterium]|nr:50S ribosomal protein L4 [Candidatus Gracilibacteria bacterium]MDD2908841.1 50S ribosomal protein L4 [Candidatus Gracilibacteria bacterium]